MIPFSPSESSLLACISTLALASFDDSYAVVPFWRIRSIQTGWHFTDVWPFGSRRVGRVGSPLPPLDDNFGGPEIPFHFHPSQKVKMHWLKCNGVEPMAFHTTAQPRASGCTPQVL